MHAAGSGLSRRLFPRDSCRAGLRIGGLGNIFALNVLRLFEEGVASLHKRAPLHAIGCSARLTIKFVGALYEAVKLSHQFTISATEKFSF